MQAICRPCTQPVAGQGQGSLAGPRGRARAGEGHLQAMVVVHHGGHAIEAVAVKLVLVHPPARIGQQEAQRLPVACGRACALRLGVGSGMQRRRRLRRRDRAGMPGGPARCYVRERSWAGDCCLAALDTRRNSAVQPQQCSRSAAHPSGVAPGLGSSSCWTNGAPALPQAPRSHTSPVSLPTTTATGPDM